MSVSTTKGLGVSLGRRSRFTLRQREAISAYLMISPWLVGFVVFTLGPMIASSLFSLSSYNIISSPKFIGLGNYIKMFTDDTHFWHSLRITLTYAVAAIPLGLIFGLALALLLNARVLGIAAWRTVYYLPSIVPAVASAILWIYIFNPRFGIANWLLSVVNIKGPGWLSDPDWALTSLILMSLWGVGGGMIIYLAGLQSIPTTLYEAAAIDGANSVQSFWVITLPLITPVLFYNLVIGIIGTFQYFTNAYIMTDGGPAEATLFYNLYLYNNAFRYLDMGYASALAWVLFAIVLLLTLLVFRSSAAWVYYEGEVRRN